MRTINFRFLDNPLLLHHAALAEKFCHSHPAESLVNLRQFSEALIDLFYEKLKVAPLIPDATQGSRIEHLFALRKTDPRIAAIFTKKIVAHFHKLREAGNWAAHVRPLETTRDAEAVLKTAWKLAVWYDFKVCRHKPKLKKFNISSGHESKTTLEFELALAQVEIEDMKAEMRRALRTATAWQERAKKAEIRASSAEGRAKGAERRADCAELRADRAEEKLASLLPPKPVNRLAMLSRAEKAIPATGAHYA
jgi:hypothetical protein